MKYLFAMALMVLSISISAKTPLPGDSVLQLSDQFTDQQGRTFQLQDRSGQVQLVTMFYTSCGYVCPLIIDAAKGVDHALTAQERSRWSVLLISLDPERDSVRALSELAAKRKLDTQRWTLARTEKSGVRKAAAVLGVRYRELANGEFNHSSALILLDADGRILARTEQLGTKPDPQFLAAVKAALAK